ncbi:MAG: Surfactin synthase thioesterase subunit [uncultured Sulfurovum sp.]|uniref:Surfactin synthase thioesterase subunit n=1 Tax=uncultured Sulfurovum sp. TaxID=269237 RepID=A0A6S6SEM3_9BACT|nr:MAG: Surfactin synthase thioesterase subunit [uncultured Sulfurovum sp.]
MSVHKKILFTIPFAGGNKFSFKAYETFLKNDFDIYPLELPGRGDRFSENLMTDIYSVRDDLFNQMKDYLDRDYIIYGHSLGGLLSYLVTLLIEEKNLKKPLHLIISGRANPSMKAKVIRHTLTKVNFINNLKNLGGMPSDFFKHPDLFDIFEPILRADFKISECFYLEENKKVYTKLSILYGDNDSFNLKEARAWENFTYHKPITLQKFKGNHFFIYKHVESICNLIKAS